MAGRARERVEDQDMVVKASRRGVRIDISAVLTAVVMCVELS